MTAMANAKRDLLIFDDFLTHLHRQGFEIGVDHYLRLHELLSKVSGECGPQDLKSIVCPIFATSRAQQEQFHLAFDSYFGLFQSPSATATPGKRLEENLLVSTEATKPARRRKRLYVLGAVVLVLVASTAIWLRVRQHDGTQDQSTTAQDNSQQPIPTQTQPSPQIEPSRAPTPLPAAQAAPPTPAAPSFAKRYVYPSSVLLVQLFKVSHGLAVLWLAILGPLLIFLFYYQPLQRNNAKATFYDRFRPLLFWLTIFTQPLLWLAFPELHELWWFKDSSTWLPILAAFLFFLLYWRMPQSSFKPQFYERFRVSSLCLAVLTSLALFVYGSMIHGAAVFAPVIFFVIYEWRRYQRRQLLLQKQRGRKPPFNWPIRIQAFAPKLFDSDLFYQTARLMRRRQTNENCRLDVEATVAASIESLGYSTFRYKLDTRPPEYLVLIDRASFRDHQAQMFNELAKALERDGIFVVRYFYEADPRVCCSETGNSCLSLVELHSKFAGHRLLVFGNGNKLLDPLTGALGTWTTVFSDWADRALLTPTPPAQWGFTEISLASLFLILPASLEGLLTLVTHFDSLAETDIRGLPASGTETVAALEIDQTSIVESLRLHLGEQAFQWLCACAVYPELQWDLTLYLGSLPVMGGDLVREDNLLRLSRLLWFQSGSIPNEMRWLLLKELDPDRERAIRLALIELLERDPPPAETYAADLYQLNLVVQRWLSRRDRQRSRELLETLEATSQQQLTSDYTLLRFLEAAPPSPLNVYLPTSLRQAFYRKGVPAFGLKTSVRLVMLIVIIGLGFVTCEYARQFVSAPTESADLREVNISGYSLRLGNLVTSEWPHAQLEFSLERADRTPFRKLSLADVEAKLDDQLLATRDGDLRVTASEGSSVLVLLDGSASMSGGFGVDKLRFAKEALKTFINNLDLGSRVAVAVFAEEVFILVPVTDDRDLVMRKIEDFTIRRDKSRFTRLYDAVDFGLLEARQNNITNILLISDLREESPVSERLLSTPAPLVAYKQNREQSITQFSRTNGIRIFTLTIGDWQGASLRNTGRGTLASISGTNGGTSIYVEPTGGSSGNGLEEQDLINRMQQMLDELTQRSRYSYSLTLHLDQLLERDGQEHKLGVGVSIIDSQRIQLMGEYPLSWGPFGPPVVRALTVQPNIFSQTAARNSKWSQLLLIDLVLMSVWIVLTTLPAVKRRLVEWRSGSSD